ncbi:hypothetical protein ACS0TY_015787 [Phlomoides rotata]
MRGGEPFIGILCQDKAMGKHHGFQLLTIHHWRPSTILDNGGLGRWPPHFDQQLSVLCCVTAAVIEVERLKVVKHHGLLNKPDEAVPMATYWLFFPFFLLAGLDSFIRKGVVAFYKRGSPEGMKQYCEHFADAVSGLGLVYNVIYVRIVGKISEMGGREGWFQDNLNKSRLDLYYLV